MSGGGRAQFWLVAGVIGLALGGAAAWLDVAAAGVLAVGCALVAGVAGYRLIELLRERSRQVHQLTTQVTDLEATAREEAQARARAEAELDATLATNLDRTAVRRDAASEPESLTDPETDLYSEAYFMVAIEARVAAARRQLQPVAVVLLEFVEGLETAQPHPVRPLEVATGIRECLREADTACRLGGGGYSLLLEDTPETGAIWTVERLRRHMAAKHTELTLWAGIACYPAHGFSSTELLDRAEAALGLAKEWRQDRIEVAHAD